MEVYGSEFVKCLDTFLGFKLVARNNFPYELDEESLHLFIHLFKVYLEQTRDIMRYEVSQHSGHEVHAIRTLIYVEDLILKCSIEFFHYYIKRAEIIEWEEQLERKSRSLVICLIY